MKNNVVFLTEWIFFSFLCLSILAYSNTTNTACIGLLSCLTWKTVFAALIGGFVGAIVSYFIQRAFRKKKNV